MPTIINYLKLCTQHKGCSVIDNVFSCFQGQRFIVTLIVYYVIGCNIENIALSESSF